MNIQTIDVRRLKRMWGVRSETVQE